MRRNAIRKECVYKEKKIDANICVRKMRYDLFLRTVFRGVAPRSDVSCTVKASPARDVVSQVPAPVPCRSLGEPMWVHIPRDPPSFLPRFRRPGARVAVFHAHQRLPACLCCARPTVGKILMYVNTGCYERKEV